MLGNKTFTKKEQTDRQPLFEHDDIKSYAAYGVVHKN